VKGLCVRIGSTLDHSVGIVARSVDSANSSYPACLFEK
jgi:hypothetical protein